MSEPSGLQVLFADDAAPSELSATRSDHGVVDPHRADAFAAFIAEVLVPDLRNRDGYRALEVRADRATGDVFVITWWTDADTRRGAAPAFLPVLQQGAGFGLRPIAIEESEGPEG